MSRIAKTAIVITSLSALAGCDYFVRFAQTKYECASNRLGVEQIELQKRSGSERAIVTVNRQDVAGNLISEADGWHIRLDQLTIYHNTASGRFSALHNGRYHTLSCAQGEEFAM